jgi:hypothetical protein
MNDILLFVGLFLGFSPCSHQYDVADCVLKKSFETELLKVHYSENWNHFSYQGGNSLIYYEEANFARREEAEIVFFAHPVKEGLEIDTTDVASRFLREKLSGMKSDPKFQGADIDVTMGEETIERINDRTWHKILISITRTDDATTRKRQMNVWHYFNYRPGVVYTVSFSETMPKISTVEKEFPCILKRVEFRK